MRFLAWLGLLALSLASAAAGAEREAATKTAGYVVDQVGLVTPATRQAIEDAARSFEARKGTRISVLVTDADPGAVDPGDGVILVVQPRLKRAQLAFANALKENLSPYEVKRISELAIRPPTKDWDAGHWVEEAVLNVMAVLEFGRGSYAQTFLAKPVGLNSVQRAQLAEWGLVVPVGAFVLVFFVALGLSRRGRARPSVAGIVAGNLVPLAGVLALDWDVLSVFLVFWMENVAIMAMDVARVILGRPERLRDIPSKIRDLAVALIFLPTFALGHAMVILAIFVRGDFERIRRSPNQVADIVAYVDMLGLGPAFWVIAAIQLATFLGTFILGGEYRIPGAGNPYRSFGRIFVLHVALVLGAFAIIALGSPVWVLVVLVLAKTCAELMAVLLLDGATRAPDPWRIA